MSSAAKGLAGRYATALFELAEADKALDRVADDLKALAKMIEESADLTRLIRSPVISRGDQGKAMAALGAKAGLAPLTGKFLGLLARNRRLFTLPAIIASYLGLLAARRGETTAEVVSAKPLSPTQFVALTDALKKAIGSQVAIHTKVDAELLGGLIVKVGSRMIDSSLKTQFQRLRLAMKGVQ